MQSAFGSKSEPLAPPVLQQWTRERSRRLERQRGRERPDDSRLFVSECEKEREAGEEIKSVSGKTCCLSRKTHAALKVKVPSAVKKEERKKEEERRYYEHTLISCKMRTSKAKQQSSEKISRRQQTANLKVTVSLILSLLFLSPRDLLSHSHFHLANQVEEHYFPIIKPESCCFSQTFFPIFVLQPSYFCSRSTQHKHHTLQTCSRQKRVVSPFFSVDPSQKTFHTCLLIIRILILYSCLFLDPLGDFFVLFCGRYCVWCGSWKAGGNT